MASDGCCAAYWKKWAGAKATSPPTPPVTQSLWSALNSFLGMAAVGLAHKYYVAPTYHVPLDVPAFGAMAVLLFSGYKAPPSQPFNTIVGNTLGGVVGWLTVDGFGLLGAAELVWTQGALAVAATIALQEVLSCQHPPGGATALIYVLMPNLHHMHFWYVVTPAFVGAVLMTAVAVVTNNLSASRSYPERWYPTQEPEQAPPAAVKLVPVTEDGKQADEEGSAEESGEESAVVGAMKAYTAKFRGSPAGPAPPRPGITATLWSFGGAFVGMSVLGLLHFHFALPVAHLPLLVAAFGAMSVLLFSLIKAPFAQPLNTVVGNTIGGLVGAAVVVGSPFVGLGGAEHYWLTGAVAVSATIFLQERVNAVHPPGGATALLCVLLAPIHKLHFMFALCPAFAGAVIMVLVATAWNNLAPARTYPQRWGYDDAEPEGGK